MPYYRTKKPHQCARCGATFFPPHANLAKGKGRFCSKQCWYAFKSSSATPPHERFWRHVRKTESCWLWIGSLVRGHGQLFAGTDADGKRRKVYAHRLSWEMHRGPIPEGAEVCHNCPCGDNPACVNPDHLFLGSHRDNLADAAKKERLPRGISHPVSKLTAEKVRAIRTRYAAGGISQAALGREYGVSQGSIDQVVHRESWKHVP